MKSDKKLEKKLKKAKIHMLLDNPFYATLLLDRKTIIDYKGDKAGPFQTACTDGSSIWFHHNFLETLQLEEVKTVLAHEIMHIALCHHLRIKQRSLPAWGVATDFAVNCIVFKDFQKLNNSLYDTQYEGMSAENIYNRLPKDMKQKLTVSMKGKGLTKKQMEEITGGKSLGEFTAPPEGINPIEEEARIKETVTRAIEYAKAAGKIPAGLGREIDDFLKPKIAWERLLAEWVDTKAKNDYSWQRRNPRISKCFLPSLYSEELGTIVLAIDTSGSVDKALLNRFCSEINGLRGKYQFECILISCDSQIYNPTRFMKYERINFDKVKGGGGTAFSPVFNWVEENVGDTNIVGLIYFTDLYCSDFPSKHPKYDTLWMNYGERRNKTYEDNNVPFGKVIDMDY